MKSLRLVCAGSKSWANFKKILLADLCRGQTGKSPRSCAKFPFESTGFYHCHNAVLINHSANLPRATVSTLRKWIEACRKY